MGRRRRRKAKGALLAAEKPTRKTEEKTEEKTAGEPEKQEESKSREPEEKKEARKEICSLCGLSWGVSRLAKIPESGYICPWCRERGKQ